MATLAKVKKGDTVMYCMFTGMRVGPKEVVACDKDTITISRNKKGEATFSRKTGKLISPMPENEKFASHIEEDDGKYVHPVRKKSKAKKEKTRKAKTKVETQEPEEEDIEEETPAPAPEPKKKEKKTKAKKTSKKKPEPEPEEDDEFDDDDFEEVE